MSEPYDPLHPTQLLPDFESDCGLFLPSYISQRILMKRRRAEARVHSGIINSDSESDIEELVPQTPPDTPPDDAATQSTIDFASESDEPVPLMLEDSGDSGSKPSRPSRSNAYCLTINNPTDSTLAVTKAWITANCEYGIVGNEVGETGTAHLQVYFRCKNARMFTAVSRAFPGAHVETAKSGDSANQTYCSKDGDSWEFGTPSKQGSRSDLQALVGQILDGSTFSSYIQSRDVTNLSTYLRMHNGASALEASVAPKRDKRITPTVIWCYGLTGTGKSHWIHNQVENKDFYTQAGERHWFDGYNNNPIVVLDDFRDNEEDSYGMTFNFLLRLLDKYPFRVPVKGGQREMVATTFYISCPTPPSMTYLRQTDVNKKQLLRRITKVIHFSTFDADGTKELVYNMTDVASEIGNADNGPIRNNFVDLT